MIKNNDIKYCLCGCGCIVKSGNSYVNHHSIRGYKHTPEAILKIKESRKNQKPPMLGKKLSEEHKLNLSKSKKGCIVSNEKRLRISNVLKEYYKTHKHPSIGRTVSQDTKQRLSKYAIDQWRSPSNRDKFKKAIEERTASLKKNGKYKIGISYTPEYRKAQKHKRRFLGGTITAQTIQNVYKDNVKKYGVLTCYLCMSPIGKNEEHIEHKTPISRGGTNEYSNLGISCKFCNYKKHNKTEDEYRKVTGHA